MSPERITCHGLAGQARNGAVRAMASHHITIVRMIARLGSQITEEEMGALGLLMAGMENSPANEDNHDLRIPAGVSRPDSLLTAEEAASLLRTSRWTLYRMLETKQLPKSCWFRVGRAYRFHRDQLLSFSSATKR